MLVFEHYEISVRFKKKTKELHSLMNIVMYSYNTSCKYVKELNMKII